MYSCSNISWSCKQLSSMIGRKTIKFDSLVQRAFVWDIERKSLLIQSLCIGVPVPAIYAKRDGEDKNNRTYSVLDGLQRLTTISQYLNGDFALSNVPIVDYFDEVTGEETEIDISGKYFDDLPEGLRDKIYNVHISVIYFDTLSDDEERELFRRLNNGKPLTAKNKALASCPNIEEVLEVASHDIFDEMLTDRAKANKTQAIIAIKSWFMAFYNLDTISFDSKTLNLSIEEIEMEEDEKVFMDELFTLMLNTHTSLIDKEQKKVAKKLYTELHFVSLIPFFAKVVKKELSSPEETMSEWLIEFFGSKDKTSISDSYNEACKSGVNKNSAILQRHSALEESYMRFFDESYEEELIPTKEDKDVNDEPVEESTDQTNTETEEVEDEDTSDVEEYDGDKEMSDLVQSLMNENDQVDLGDIWG